MEISGLHDAVITRYVSRDFARKVDVAFTKTKLRDVVRVETEERWIPIYIGDWIAALRLVAQNGQPVVGEIRVFPNDGIINPSQGLWSGELLGFNAKAPTGGLTTRLLRQIKLGSASEFIGRAARSVSLLQNTPSPSIQRVVTSLSKIFPEGEAGRSRRGKIGRTDRFYAELANEYADLVNSGVTKPNTVIAQQRRLKQPQVRDMIHEARKRGFLSPFHWGKPGGQITPKTVQLLQSKRQKKGGVHGRQRQAKGR